MANTISIVLEGVDQTRGMLDGAADALGRLGGVAAGVVTAGFAAAAAAAGALTVGLGFSIAQALEAEKSLARLGSVIQSTGGAAGVTLEEAQGLAEQFMNLAGGSDDAVLSIIEMGLRMGNISEEQMPQFIQTALDLAAATGVDATAGARLLAQAMEDPISALTRFRRMGIQFTEEQEAQIKAMIEAGDVAGANALIMERLGEATGGAAAAQAGTLAGQWEILKGRMGEAAETIGTAFLPVLHELFDSVIAPAIPVVEALAAQFAGQVPVAIEQARGILQGLVDFFTTTLLPAFQPIIAAVMNVATTFALQMPMIQTYVQDMVNFVIGQINILSPTLIANIASTLNSLAEFWREHGDTIMAVVNFAFRVIVATVGGALTLLSGIISAVMDVINGDWTGAWETIKNTLATFMNLALAIVGTNLEEFTTVWTNNWNMAVTIVTTLWQIIKDTIGTKITEIVTAIGTFVLDIIGKFQAIDWAQVGGDIINGIGAGISAAVGGLAAAAANAARAALDAAKAALGINSPSTAFAEVGVNMMRGMAAGVRAGSGQAQAAVGGAASSVISTANSYTYNYYGVQADMDYGYQRARAGAL